MGNEKFVSIRECELKTDNVCKVLESFDERIDRLEDRFWWIITLLVGNLVGIIALFIKGGIK